MDNVILRIILFVVGLVFLVAGGRFAKDSLEAKDLIESTLFGLFGVVIGLFCIGIGVFGPPD